ncbi:MAG: hypothetical protein OXL37_02845 [Chloroflexota bacterium]|nr:hypothetical protein [Chloroflexota bacterium]MDE2961922.1 hypothetical protein [Chloroflexota bacterium]
MSNFVSGPTTYDQLRWSSQVFRTLSDDATCIAARAESFRGPILSGQSDADWSALIGYVNQWGCRIPQHKAEAIAAAVADAARYLEPMAASSLEFDDLRCSTLDVVERAFDCLTEANGVGPTGASAILTVINPRLFVSWGAGIREAYFPQDRPNGATYSQFLTVMRMAALSIASDARAKGIDDPAGTLSTQLGIDPPFSLAKFVDEYNWVTLERDMVFQPGAAVAV